MASATTFATIHAPRLEWLARAEPEPVLDPDLPIVDTHMHLWEHSGYAYFAEQYAQDVAECGHRVEASVYVECFHHYWTSGPEHLKYVGETEFAVAQARTAAADASPCRIAAGIVGHADLTLGRDRVEEVLRSHIDAGQGRFRGVRQLGKWDADPAVRGQYSASKEHLYLDPEFGRGLDVLTSLGLSFDASLFHPQLRDVAALARAHPDANIVVIHCGSPVGHGAYAGRERENFSEWLAGMRELARCPNVAVKLGGILINLANFDFGAAPRPPTSRQLADLWRPYLESCIELMGVRRCMVSSNFPVDKVGFGYGTAWNMFKHIAAGCSRDEKEALFSGTARRVYRLE